MNTGSIRILNLSVFLGTRTPPAQCSAIVRSAGFRMQGEKMTMIASAGTAEIETRFRRPSSPLRYTSNLRLAPNGFACTVQEGPHRTDCGCLPPPRIGRDRTGNDPMRGATRRAGCPARPAGCQRAQRRTPCTTRPRALRDRGAARPGSSMRIPHRPRAYRNRCPAVLVVRLQNDFTTTDLFDDGIG